MNRANERKKKRTLSHFATFKLYNIRELVISCCCPKSNNEVAWLLALTQASLVESVTDVLVVASIVFVRVMRWFTALAPFNVANVMVGTAIESSKEKPRRTKTRTLARHNNSKKDIDEFTTLNQFGGRVA